MSYCAGALATTPLWEGHVWAQCTYTEVSNPSGASWLCPGSFLSMFCILAFWFPCCCFFFVVRLGPNALGIGQNAKALMLLVWAAIPMLALILPQPQILHWGARAMLVVLDTGGWREIPRCCSEVGLLLQLTTSFILLSRRTFRHFWTWWSPLCQSSTSRPHLGHCPQFATSAWAFSTWLVHQCT